MSLIFIHIQVQIGLRDKPFFHNPWEILAEREHHLAQTVKQALRQSEKRC